MEGHVPMRDGDKEIIDGIETGLIWSTKYQDWILPDLDYKKEKYKPQAEKNIQICYTCDQWKPSTRQCKECGCFMDVKGIVFRLINKSIGVKFSTCPLGKW